MISWNKYQSAILQERLWTFQWGWPEQDWSGAKTEHARTDFSFKSACICHAVIFLSSFRVEVFCEVQARELFSLMFFIKKLDFYIPCWIWALYPGIWVRCLKIKHSSLCCNRAAAVVLCFFVSGTVCDSHQPSYLQSLALGNWKLQLLEHGYLILHVKFVFYCNTAKKMFVQLIRHLSRGKRKCHVLVEWDTDVELILDRLTRSGDTEGWQKGTASPSPQPLYNQKWRNL